LAFRRGDHDFSRAGSAPNIPRDCAGHFRPVLRTLMVGAFSVAGHLGVVAGMDAVPSELGVTEEGRTLLLEFLGRLRRRGLSAQTYNHYLKAAKQFTRWLVRDQRTPTDPLAHLSRLNVKVDRRHDRRALSEEEFTRLIRKRPI
jgi:hypothetical protein